MTSMVKIARPDGSVREMVAGSTPADVAAAIRLELLRHAPQAGTLDSGGK